MIDGITFGIVKLMANLGNSKQIDFETTSQAKVTSIEIHQLHELPFCPSIFVSREATKNGHGHGAYNLVAGHLQGYDTDVEEQ